MMGGSVSGDVGPLATLRVTGAAVPGLPAVPVRPQPRDLRGAELAGRRRLVFGMGGGMGQGARAG